MHIIAATSRSDAACRILHELFEETVVVSLLTKSVEVNKLLSDANLSGIGKDIDAMSNLIIDRLGSVGCKTALRLVERAISTTARNNQYAKDSTNYVTQLVALKEILDDLSGDEDSAGKLCEII